MKNRKYKIKSIFGKFAVIDAASSNPVKYIGTFAGCEKFIMENK